MKFMVVIVLTGVPGTGKTTIAKLLSDRINAKYINILDYAKEKGFIINYDPTLQTYIVDEDKLIEDLTKFIKENPSNYVIEGNFAHLLPKEVVDLYIVLKCDPNELYKRLNERGYPIHKIFENIWAMNLEIIEDELESEGKTYMTLDTTQLNPERIVEEILRRLNK